MGFEDDSNGDTQLLAELWGGEAGLRDGENFCSYVHDACWFVVFISCDDFFFSLTHLVRGLSDLLKFSKGQHLVSFIFLDFCAFFCIDFCTDLCIIFLLINLGLISSSFSSFFRWKLKSLI